MISSNVVDRPPSSLGELADLTAMTEVIGSSGDIILVMGAEKKRIRVSSALLMQGSPVFGAMFSGKFNEGFDLSSDSPKDIELPEDDAYLMCILLLTLHRQSKRVVIPTLDLADIYEFVDLVDKYDCATAVQATCSRWLQQMTPTSVEEHVAIIEVAELNKSNRALCRSTRALIFAYPWPINNLSQMFVIQPPEYVRDLIADMAERRDATLWELESLLDDPYKLAHNIDNLTGRDEYITKHSPAVAEALFDQIYSHVEHTICQGIERIAGQSVEDKIEQRIMQRNEQRIGYCAQHTGITLFGSKSIKESLDIIRSFDGWKEVFSSHGEMMGVAQKIVEGYLKGVEAECHGLTNKRLARSFRIPKKPCSVEVCGC